MVRLGIDSTIMIGATARRSKRAGMASIPANSSLSVCGNAMVWSSSECVISVKWIW